jgi:hypothetical protein
MGRVKSTTLDTHDAAYADFTGRADGTAFKGRIVTITSNNNAVFIIGIAANRQWNNFETTFNAMAEAFEFAGQ